MLNCNHKINVNSVINAKTCVYCKLFAGLTDNLITKNLKHADHRVSTSLLETHHSVLITYWPKQKLFSL